MRRRALIGLCTMISLLCLAAPAWAVSTGISGTVTDHTNGQPLARVQVNVLDAATGQLVNSTCTDSSGQYTFGGLASGSYIVGFESTAGTFRVCGGQTNYLPQFWPGANTAATARAVDVPAGTTIGGIDAAMDPGGAIAGTVTDATDGKAAAGVEVDAFDGSGNLVSSTCTQNDGSYALFALATGDYRVQYRNTSACGAGTTFRSQYYSGQSSLAASDPVHVLVTQTTAGINAALIPTSAHTLTVTFAGTGGGSVQFSPFTVFCTRSCVLPLTGTQTLTLTAAPNSTSTFTGWGGGGCSGTWTCSVKSNADVAVTATFGRAGASVGSGATGAGQTGSSASGPTGGRGGPASDAGAGPKCTASLASARITMVRPASRKVKRRQAGKAKARPGVPTLILRYRCSQGARLSTHAVARVTRRINAPPGHRVRTRATTIRMTGPSRSVTTAAGRLSITLPASVLRAARSRTTVSVTVTVIAANGHGSTEATAFVARLRAP